jgi:hypothetical protein
VRVILKAKRLQRVGIATNHFQNWFNSSFAESESRFSRSINFDGSVKVGAEKLISPIYISHVSSAKVMECNSSVERLLFATLTEIPSNKLPHFFQRVALVRKSKRILVMQPIMLILFHSQKSLRSFSFRALAWKFEFLWIIVSSFSGSDAMFCLDESEFTICFRKRHSKSSRSVNVAEVFG